MFPIALDGKPLRNPDYEHRIALERKPLQKPDFEHRIALDGKPLRKPDAEHVDEEKAVLKLPHNLDEESKKLNFDQHRFGNSLEDARPVARAPAAVIDDQAQFPDDQARGMTLNRFKRFTRFFQNMLFN
jgi:hypothetical protein